MKAGASLLVVLLCAWNVLMSRAFCLANLICADSICLFQLHRPPSIIISADMFYIFPATTFQFRPKQVKVNMKTKIFFPFVELFFKQAARDWSEKTLTSRVIPISSLRTFCLSRPPNAHTQIKALMFTAAISGCFWCRAAPLHA